MAHNIIDGYRKIEGNYPTYREYLIHFYCKDCSNFWAVDDKEINISEDDDISQIDDIIEDIADANWELLYASSDEFYTSDNPVTIIARNDMPVTYCDAIKYFSEIYYPLNSKLTLHIKAQRPASPKKINIRVCDSDELLAINNLIVKNAVKYVIYATNLTNIKYGQTENE